MKNHYQFYRNDDPATLDPDMRRLLDEEYLPTLINIEETNPKILVVFSAGNAVGKSTLSRLIAQELKAVVLENDAIKRTILRKFPDIDRENKLNILTWQYSMDVYFRISNLTGNGLLVRDGVIDWYFDRILPLFEDNGYKIFVIQYEISKQKAAELVISRGDIPTDTVDHLLQQIDEHAMYQRQFRKEYSADVVLNEKTIYNHEMVIDMLRSTIDNLRA